MKRNVNQRRFELEALEPRLLLSADPLLVAGAMSAEANSLSAIEESYLPESIPIAIAYDATTLVGDIFAGLPQEDSAFPPEPSGGARESQTNNDSIATEIAPSQPVTPDSLSTPSATESVDSITAVAQDVSSVTDQLTETLHVANAPPEPSPQISQNTSAVPTATAARSAAVSTLSFRNGTSLNAVTISHVVVGQPVYLRADAYGMNGATIYVDIYEDDGAAIGDDLVATLPITINSQGFGTQIWFATRDPNDTSTPDNSYYLQSGFTYSGTLDTGHFLVTAGPRVISQSPSGIVSGIPAIDHLDLLFDAPITLGTLTKFNFFFRGNQNQLVPGMISSVFLTNPTTIQITFSSAISAAGTYTVEVPAGIKDLNGHQLDQDGDGILGEALEDKYYARIIVEPPFEAGVTVITHGFQPTAGVTGWAVKMAEEILDLAARGNGANYGTILIHDTSTGRWRKPTPSESNHNNTYKFDEEVVAVFDWSGESDRSSTGWILAAADTLFAGLLDRSLPQGLAGRSLLDLARKSVANFVANFHFIGHSRGAVLNTLVVGELAQAFPDLKIDQVTSLDPHPAYDFGDPWSEPSRRVLPTFTNVSYADDFYQIELPFYDPNGIEFDGIPANGASNHYLNQVVLDQYGYGLAGGGAHADVHLWYHGTIDRSNAASDGSQFIGFDMRKAWYADDLSKEWYAADGFNEGYAASRIAGKLGRPTSQTGKTQATASYATGGSPLLPLTIFNGDFDSFADNFSIPGWTDHGPSSPGLLYPETGTDWYLQLDGSADSRTHNPFYLPNNAQSVEFDVAVMSLSINPVLKVFIDSTPILTLIPNGAPGVFTHQVATIPKALRGTARSLTFKFITSDPSAKIGIDNVTLTAPISTLTPQQQTKIINALHQLSNLSTAIDGQNNLNLPLPLLSHFDKNTLNKLFHNSPGPDIGDFFGFEQVATDYFASGTPTTDGFLQALSSHATQLLGNFADGVSGNDPFTITGGYDSVLQELRFDVEFNFTKTRQIPLALNALAVDLGLTLDADLLVDLTAALNLSFSFGIDQNLEAFVRLNNLTADASVNATNMNAGIHLGFLDAAIQNGTAALAAHFGATLTDPTPFDNRITLSEIPVGGLSALFNLTPPISNLHIELPIYVSFAGYTTPPGTKIVIDDSDLFSLPPPTVTATGLSSLVDFSNITPAQVVDLLKRLGDWLGTYRDSEFFDLELPFTGGKKVGDWFDSGTAFIDTIYKRMIRREVVATGGQSSAFRTLGQLTADAHFQVIVGADAPVSVTVNYSNTFDNSTLADAVADFDLALPAALAAKVQFIITPEGRLSLALRDGQTADTLKLDAASASDPIVTEAGFTATQDSTVAQRFSTVQEFATLLNTVLSPFVFTPAYDPVNKEVTMAVHFDWTYAKTAPINFGGALGPIANFSTAAEFTINATLTLDFTLGFALKPKNTPQLVTTAFVPPPSDGKLHADSSFYVVVGTDAPVLVTLTVASTSGNSSLADLVADLNTALANAGLANKVRAKIVGGTHLALAVLNEDLDGDGHLDVHEDLDGDGKLDRDEDLDHDGHLDIFEDLNGNGTLQGWEDADGDGHLDVKEDFDGNGLLGIVNEDLDGDGHLDVNEDTLIVNSALDSLLGVQTLRIVADAADPIFTEIGILPDTARAESRGLFIDNAKITGTLDVSLANITANARFSIFGIQISNGSAAGHVAFDAMLQNRAANSRRVPLTELFAAANADALSEVLSNSTGLGTQPTLTGSLNLTLGPTITLSPPFFTLPADAQIIIAIPDITKLRDPNGQLAIHAGTDLVVPTPPVDPGIWLVYPNLDGLAQFSCLDIPAYILALDQLVQDLGQLSTFDFLNEPLPLINQSLSGLIGQMATLAQWLNDVRSNPGDTLTALETNLETALNIDPSLFTLSIDDVPNPSLAANGTAAFNPLGDNNALFFTNNSSVKITVRIVDEGNINDTLTPDPAVATWDGTNNILTIEVNSGRTTADHVIAAVSGSGAPVIVVRDFIAEPGNTGAGVITKTALKLHFNYTLAYGIQRPFELNLTDLVPLLPAGSPAAGLLAGLTSFIDVEGTGKLTISASAALIIDFGLDLTNPCAPRPFFYDSTELTLKGRVTATDLDFKAALGPLGIFVVNGSAAFDLDGNAATADDATFSLGLQNNMSGRYYLQPASNFFDIANFALTVDAAVGVTLPLFFPAQSLPYGGSAADGNDSDTYPDNYLVVSIPSLIDLFHGVQGSVIVITPDFNSLLGNLNLCDLIQSSGVLLDGLDELLGKIETGLDEVAFSGNFPLVGDKLAQGANFIRSFRNGLLAEMRNKLATVGGDPIELVKEAVWNVLGQPGLDILVDPITGNTLTGFSDLDIECIPSGDVVFNLRLKKSIAVVDTSANPIAIDIGVPTLGLEINGSVQIEVGFDLRLNFGINKTDGFYFKTDNPGGLPELIVDLKVTTPGLDVTGSLFFLQLNVKDGHGGSAFSHFGGLLTVDLLNSDDKLTFAEMRSGAFSFGDVFAATISATAEVNLDLVISFGGNAAFPTITAEFDLDWTWTNQSASGGTLSIAFNHITIDAGSYLSNLLLPILQQVQKVTGPVAPIAKMLVTPIPGLSDLAGNDITFLDLAEGFGYLKPSTRKFIETVVGIIDIINSMTAAAGDTLSFDLGSYSITGGGPTDIAGGTWQQGARASGPGDLIREALGDLRELGFEFPILSLSEIFKLIQGQPASLVEYTMPTLEFSFTFSQSISLYPPFLTLVLGGTVSARLDLTFGFDTYGILIYKESRNVLDILQGIYIKDIDSNGVDVPEMVLSGGIFAGAAAGVSFGPIEVLAGVGGGLFIELEFNLNDPDADGKVRALEILANAERDIRCIFDIHGRIYLVLSAFLKVKAVFLKFEMQWDFPEITLYEFDITCPPPILAHTNGGELVLHVGPNAHLREEIDTDDNDETFVVQHLSGTAGNETVMVKWNGFQKEFTGISSILADGGNGNDTLDAHGVLALALFNGGVGDDLIYASDNANNVLHGDAGNDTIVGAMEFANTMIFGDDGNDTITGGPDDDILHGGAGNDTIAGNGGNDVLYGEDGNDALTTLGGTDLLLGGEGNDLLDGGEGDDKLFGENGNDRLSGGRGNDWLVGDVGADTLDGGAGEDVLVGDLGMIVSRLEVRDITGVGDDLLIGGAGSDVLFGGGGSDSMFGGALMNSGTATPLDPDGVDFMDGGTGDDVAYADDAFAPVGVRPSGPTVSGRVWSDTNGDGIRNSTEPGMAGVTVELYNATTFVIEDTVTTNAAGNYSFTGLHAGSYYVNFLKLSTDQVFSPQDAGSNDAVDSDADATSGQSAVFALAATGTAKVDAGLRGPPIVVIDDVTKIEGSTLGTTAFTFTVSLSAPSALTVTVNYQTTNGVATAPADYTAIPAIPTNTLTFTPGTTSLTITVLVSADNVYENNEDFHVLLSNALEGNSTALAIAKATGQGVILHDDPRPAITIDDRTVTETSGGTTVKFTFRLSNPSSQTITVGWTTADAANAMGENSPDSAHFGDDYTAATGTITFLPGVTERTDAITINVLDDALDERAEHFLIVLANPINASILDGFGNATIEDDDAPPVVNISPALVTITEGHAGYHLATFTISLNVPSGLEVKVDWATARGTATDVGSSTFDQPDFENATGAVVFSPGAPTSQTITVKILGDTSIEDTEYFFVNLIRADNATIGDNHAIVEITDDDNGSDLGPWYVQFSDVKYTVSEDAGFVAITLVRAAGSSQGVVVFYTQNGSAIAGLDYTSIRTLVRFAEDEIEKTVLIPILNDTLIEGIETVNLFIRNPTGGPARGEFPTATLCILDDEPRPTVTIDDATVTEGDVGTTTITFTFHLSAMAEIPVNVPWSTNNRAAIGGFDYITAAGIATFGIHALTATITITVKNDVVPEPVEEFVINLGMPDEATLADHQGLGTIVDNDKTPISGQLFLDEDADGYYDSAEHGLANVQANVTDYTGASVTVLTNSAGGWNTAVLMGATKIEVAEPGLPPGLLLSTGNNPQTVTISDTVATGADVGYKPELLPNVPSDAIGEGSGGLDDTVFGGLDNDIINGGGGHDYLIGDHWLLGAGNLYDAVLVQANVTSRINLAPLSMNASGTISGLVWDDLDGDGFRDGNEPGRGGVQVNLFDEQYVLFASTITAATGSPDPVGSYTFDDLKPATYFVQFLAPSDRAYSLRDVTPLGVLNPDDTDSDADTLTGFTVAITLGVGAGPTHVDAGLAGLPTAGAGPWGVQFEFGVYNVFEDAGNAAITILRTPSSTQLRGFVYTADGTATLLGNDYLKVQNLLVQFDGQTMIRTALVPVLNDTVSEGVETVLLILDTPAPNGRGTAVLLIFDKPRPADDKLIGSAGDDVILGDSGFVDAGVATFIGGNGKDVLIGAAGFDNLYGQGGNDRLDGGGGDDLLVGDTGNDVYVFDTDTPAGTDILAESPGAANGLDTLDFSATTGVAVNADLAIGGTSQDVSVVTPAIYLILTLSDGDAIENLIGGGANDILYGNALDNVMTGGPGSDAIDGRTGTDTLAEARDVDFVLTNTTLAVVAPVELDTLVSIERVELAGGPSNNRFDVTSWTGTPVSIDGRAGTDTIISTNDANFTLTNVQLTVSPGATFLLTSIERAELTGGASPNLFNTTAFTGIAVLNGDAGDDTFFGGSGDTTYVFDTDTALGQDTITDSGGMDTLDFSLTTTQSVTVNLVSLDTGTPQPINANLTLILSGSTTMENVIGGTGDDTFTGNSLNNSFTGGAGNDTYVFDADLALGEDTIDESGGGNDTLDFSATTVGITVNLANAVQQTVHNTNLKLTLGAGNSIENIIGGAGDDTLTGNSLNNSFTGGAGDDTYLFDADLTLGEDTIDESGGGNDTLDFSATTVDITVNLSLPGQQTVTGTLKLTLGAGNSIENLIGGSGNDNLTGNANNNRIDGGGGNDILTGDLGDDTFVFRDNWGTDTVIELAGQGTDTLDFSAVTNMLTVNVAASLSVTAGVNTATHSDVNVENIIGGSADDTFTVTPSTTTAYFVDGGGGIIDILNFNPTGLVGTSGSNSFTATGRQPVTYNGFEQVNV